jgi:membrane-associated phospholipid phosphatase
MDCIKISDTILNSIPYIGFFMTDFSLVESINLSLAAYFVLILNVGIKYIFQLVGSRYNYELPILGSFCRPSRPGCNLSTPSGSMGMPSGHTQTVVFVVAYLYYRYGNKSKVVWSGIFAAIMVMYCRVASLKHSVQQVVVGALFGIMFAKIYIR